MNSVLDASALLAYLQTEPGSGTVTQALTRGSAISAVNWAEALSKLAERGEDPHQVGSRLARQGLLGVGLIVQPLDDALARETAALRGATRHLGLSLGDRACLALARTLGLPALTTDRAWASLNLGITIQVIR